MRGFAAATHTANAVPSTAGTSPPIPRHALHPQIWHVVQDHLSWRVFCASEVSWMIRIVALLGTGRP